MNIPFLYEGENRLAAQVQPSTIHVADSAMSSYFRRLLFQRVLSVFKFEGLPDTWAKNYFQTCLFALGYVAIVNTDKFGVIPQDCTLGGYNIFYQPTQALITNPLLHGLLKPKIDQECVLIKMQPDYHSCLDIVYYYADQMALLSQAIITNVYNSKLAYVIGADGKGMAETFKKMFDEIASGNPAVAVGKDMFNMDGSPKWATFTQNIGQNYIADKLLDNLRGLVNQFDSDIGIPNANVSKRERLISDEVNANNVETYCLSDVWMECIKEGCDKANKMFGLNIKVSFRYARDNNQKEESKDASDINTSGSDKL